MLEKADDKIKVLGQTPLHPKKTLQRFENMKKMKKEIEDQTQILSHTPMQKKKKKKNEVEITVEVNNQNRLKQTDKVLNDNIKKEIKVLEDICHTKKEKKAPKRLIHPKDRTKQINLKNK